MSDDTEIIEATYRAFGDGDIPTVLSVLSPSIKWIEPDGYPYGGTYRGRDEVVGLFQTASATLGPNWRVEPDRFLGTEDGVLVTGRHTGRGADGSAWEVPFAMVFTMRGGMVTRFRQYGDSALLRDAAAAASG